MGRSMCTVAPSVQKGARPLPSLVVGRTFLLKVAEAGLAAYWKLAIIAGIHTPWVLVFVRLESWVML